MDAAKTMRVSFLWLMCAVVFFIVGSLLIAGTLQDDAIYFRKEMRMRVQAFMYSREYTAFAEHNQLLASSLLQNNRVPVLVYHSIIEEDDGYNVTLNLFKKHMFALKRAGYETITAHDLYVFYKHNTPLPPHPVLVTFDDGAKMSFYPVEPILRALDFKATTFIITKYSTGRGSGGSFYLSESELRRMWQTGRWEIFSHSREAHDEYPDVIRGSGHFMSKRIFNELEGRFEIEQEFRERIANDLETSRSDLETALSVAVPGYAFPDGDFGQNNIEYPETEKIVLDAASHVYTMAFHQSRWKYPEPFLYEGRMYMIPRINVHPEWTDEDLLTAMDNYITGARQQTNFMSAISQKPFRVLF